MDSDHNIFSLVVLGDGDSVKFEGHLSKSVSVATVVQEPEHSRASVGGVVTMSRLNGKLPLSRVDSSALLGSRLSLAVNEVGVGEEVVTSSFESISTSGSVVPVGVLIILAGHVELGSNVTGSVAGGGFLSEMDPVVLQLKVENWLRFRSVFLNFFSTELSFRDADVADLVGSQGVGEDDAVARVGPTGVEVSVNRMNVHFNVFPLLVLVAPDLNRFRLVFCLHLDKARKVLRGGIVNTEHFLSLLGLSEVRLVLGEELLVNFGGMGSRFVESLVVVVGDVLLSSSSNAVVVLVDAHGIEQVPVSRLNALNVLIGSRLIEDLEREEFVARMKQGLALTHFLLGMSTRRVVTSPGVHVVVSIGEHIIIFYRPGDVLRIEGIDVGLRSRVQGRDVLVVVLVEVFDDQVHLIEVHPGVGEREVASKGNEHMISEVVSLHINDVREKLLELGVGVVGIEIGVGNHGIIGVPSLVVPEALGPAVVVTHGRGEDLLFISEVL
mmetsp:Transcript_2490/g.3835  ORF Transcript_2490/g.3835 Transcript_2490/m.3835 type:complete len:496 (-) Transcript_2490:664-2151(-)